MHKIEKDFLDLEYLHFSMTEEIGLVVDKKLVKLVIIGAKILLLVRFIDHNFQN